ncbi:MAG: multidrug efflux RND transporter permease subunit [Acidobacteriota bacterium]|nr:multidrug efflux RND transporter permease subunit [Acidobacteriota bacterium]
MNFSKFFIRRPIFAIVISLLIVLVGGLAIFSLPISEYPEITPPTVQVYATYPGANAATVEQSVAIPIEESVNGAENMIYMSSRSSNAGVYTLTCTFKVGTNVDLAAVDVQNRVQQAQGNLPSEVISNGITVKKRSPSMLMIITLYSPDSSYDSLFLSNYAAIHVIDPLSRVPGIGDFMQIGPTYSMRVWVNPGRMASLGLTASDVATAIQEQNVTAPGGQIGAPPAPKGTQYQYSVLTQGQLTTAAQYDNMIIRTLPDGSILRLKDIGHAELGGQDYSTYSRLNGAPSTTIILFQLPSANALSAAKGVKQAMDRLAKEFPAGIKYNVTMDSTLFITSSLKEVLKTLVEALLLVLLVVYLFLGTFRTTLIPMLAVPVSLIGAFAAFTALGFSINTLTMFGLVLAIGLVVDDAIVVVEAVQHHIEEGMSARDAAEKAMSEVSGPVIAIALVLTSVFVPVAFIGGITGQLYKQFALTLAVSIILSALVALTLTPALCATMLGPPKPVRGPLGWITRGFGRFFVRTTQAYTKSARRVIRRWGLAICGLVIIVACIAVLMRTIPSGFVPNEDNGYFFIGFILPDGSSLQRTRVVTDKAEAILRKIPGVENVLCIGGYSFLTSASQSNTASVVVGLKPWDQRTAKGMDVFSIMRRAAGALSVLPQAMVIPFVPPQIPGLGISGGFQMELEDRGGNATVQQLAQTAQQFALAAGKQPGLANVYNSFSTSIPQVKVTVDRDKAKTLGVPIDSVYASLQTFLGGLIINDFNRFGRVYKVMVQAQPQYRATPQDISDIYVRTASGQMAPLSTIVSVSPTTGPDIIQRFNLYRSAEISGAAAPGFSSGQALATMEAVATKSLPSSMGYDWSGTAFQEKESSGQQGPVFLLAFIFVFLFLAAMYESWAVPLAVILGVPLGVLGAYLGIWMRGLQNDVYAQIGVVMLIGLTAKNAILIVEFAKMRHEQGHKLADAALEAAQLRFRPILMTSLAFILGLLPLMIAAGAGAASRHSLGTTVVCGMISATILEVFFIPVLYVVIQGSSERFKRHAEVTAPVPPSSGPATGPAKRGAS